MKTVSPQNLHEMLLDGGEIALADVREINPYSKGHLLYAIPLPLGRLEIHVADLIPRKNTRVVLCDNDGKLSERAADRMAALGYTNVAILAGGVIGWDAAGFESFSGINVPSKAFGEFIEHNSGTPSVSSEELKLMMDNCENMVILDSRPIDEYQQISIPNGICCPGAELVYRVYDMAPSTDTTVVVNCAGRTRSIIGAQSLINAGIPNKVVALRNGAMGWIIAGNKAAHGKTDYALAPTENGLEKAKASAARVKNWFGIKNIDDEQLNIWRNERDQRSLFIMDVRTQEEYEERHIFDSIHAPGGQLIQTTDLYIGTRNARIVLVDSDGVRATMTASWLIQMGYEDVYVLEEGLSTPNLKTGTRQAPVLGLADAQYSAVTPSELKRMLEEQLIVIIDLSSSSAYRKGHLPNAWFANRMHLPKAFDSLPSADIFVLTSTDGIIAQLAANEASQVTSTPVRVLEGGNEAWKKAGLRLKKGMKNLANEPDDFWQIPFDPNRSDGKTVKEAMQTYLSWEVDLIKQIERDGTSRFLSFPK
ncbi:MAG: rhodanese-like domain-containing protein [Promethearchaeota archaeon]